jgi:hypothetical protein
MFVHGSPGSNELNPLLKGAFSRCAKRPTWPWLNGSVLQPKGMICRLCEWSFAIGGFSGEGDGQHKDTDALHLAMKDNKTGTLTDEWAEVQKEVIIKINKGQITQRLRGNKRAKIMGNMVESRRRIVELVKSEGTRVIEPMRAIALDRWMAKHPESNPREEGHIVRPIHLPGRGLIECVCMRKLPDGEYDVEVDVNIQSMIRERVDDGLGRIRRGQEEAKQKQLATSTTALSKVGKDMKVLAAPAALAICSEPSLANEASSTNLNI